MKKPIAVFFYGPADTGKTTVLNAFADIMRRLSLYYLEEKNRRGSLDRRICLKYAGKTIGIASGGDNIKMLNANFTFFSRNQCDIVFTASRFCHFDTRYSRNKKLSLFVAKYNCISVARNQATKRRGQCNLLLVREDDLFIYLGRLIRNGRIALAIG